MAKRNTKEIILFEALKLFADKGYDGVTVRDIAARVGVKQSSLYKHYASKEEILACIFAEMKSNYLEMTKSVQLPEGRDYAALAKEYQTVGIDGLKRMCEAIFLYWLTDEKGALFRRLLTLEQFKHSEAEKMLREFLLDGVLQHQAELFSEMIKNGYFKDGDPDVMALEFYAPIYLLLCKYDGRPERKEEALDLLMKFVEEFEVNHRACDGQHS